MPMTPVHFCSSDLAPKESFSMEARATEPMPVEARLRNERRLMASGFIECRGSVEKVDLEICGRSPIATAA